MPPKRYPRAVDWKDADLSAAGAAPHRCGYVALAGRPNVGKSTLLNALVGQHLSIVSPKAQTTRERVNGLVSGERHQILFIDAPGLIRPRYKLQEAMRWAADAAIEEADVVSFVADCTRPATIPDAALWEAIGVRSVPVLLVLNKCDAVDANTLARLLGGASAVRRDALAVSATTGEGLEELVDRIVPLLPESPPLYPPDSSATQPVRFFAQEYVREACLDLFHEEVPYSIASRVDEFREDGSPVYIRITIFVERPSQKGIVIGVGGSAIRQVGEASRRRIEELIGRQVYLDLRVKVMPGWPRKSARLRQLGFQVPSRARGGQKRTQALDNRG